MASVASVASVRPHHLSRAATRLRIAITVALAVCALSASVLLASPARAASALPAGLDARSVAAASAGGWVADASKTTRMLYVLHGDPASGQVSVVVASRISFGGCNRDGCFATPDGLFHVTRKGGGDYRSSQWKSARGLGAPMPWPTFFVGGIAIHADALGNSHGCIHVPSVVTAKRVHDVMPLGATVVVH